ncbi:CD209 antigen-like protein D [Sparus aurata]|uniref:CD209 antigen-like protein D n=1 Tax=Sparus aurata TaxID=8175 RepID=UPI0011C11FF1|nr:CD209 antigen-like protein D [Sparus aurata]
MSAEILAAPDSSFNVRFIRRENRGEGEEMEVEILEDEEHHTDLGSQQARPNTEQNGAAVKRRCFRAPAVTLGVMYLLMLAGIYIRYISESCKNSELSQKEKSTSHDNLNDSFCHGWKRFRCSCYYKFTEKKNWTESRTDCQSNGADLLTITTKEEHDFVKDLTEHQASWIGLQSVKSWKTEWQWVDGTAPKYV